jgi:hypothetical protein
MAETLTKLMNCTFAAREETTEGDLIADGAGYALLLRDDALAINISRELLPGNYITGSYTKTAPLAGMYTDEIGLVLPFYLRGEGADDFGVILKALFGTDEDNTDDTVDAAPSPTADGWTMSGTTINAGQLIRVEVSGSTTQPTRVLTESSGAITIWPPLDTVPTSADPVQAGRSFVLASSGHPTLSLYAYMDGDKRLTFAGCRPTAMTMTFEVGQKIPLDVTCVGLAPTHTISALGYTPTLDKTTSPLVCTGMTMLTTYAQQAKGVPTTTETILDTSEIEVTTNDKLIADVGAGVWETVAISNVSGDAGGDITLTHAALSGAVSATDTVYIQRAACPTIGSSLTVNMTMDREPINCMTSSSGKSASVYTGRTIELTKNLPFRSWQEYLLRDNVVGMELMIQAGSTDDNVGVIYFPNIINMEPTIDVAPLMMQTVTMQAIGGSWYNSGDDAEMVIGLF